MQGKSFLSGQLHQPGGHPGHFLIPVGQDHGGGHRLGITLDLEVQHPGAPGGGSQEGRLRRGRALQTRHQKPSGQIKLACL